MLVFIFIIFLLVCCLYFCLEFHLLRRNFKYYNFIINHLLSTLGDGFYLWDEKRRVEKFSPNLQMIFDNVFYSFEEFANFFKQYEVLKNNFTEARNSNKSFVIDLVGKECEIYCCCYGKSIVDYNGKIVGVLIWIHNVTDYKSKINDLNTRNAQLSNELNDYIDILNSVPIPVWKRGVDFKIRKCNKFYLKFIKDNIAENSLFNALNIAQEDYVDNENKFFFQNTLNLIINNEHKCYNFIEFMKNKEEFIGYGDDITEIKILRSKLSYSEHMKRELISNISNAVAIYDNEGRLQFYNYPFVNLWKLSKPWLNSQPTYYDFLLRVYKINKFLNKKTFNYLNNKQRDFFKKSSDPYYDFFTLKNGISLKFSVISDYLGELIFIYEDVTFGVQKNLINK